MDEANERARSKRTLSGSTKLAGMTCIGGLVVGVAGPIGAIALASPQVTSGSGLCMVASALAFGLLANALLRD